MLSDRNSENTNALKSGAFFLFKIVLDKANNSDILYHYVFVGNI